MSGGDFVRNVKQVIDLLRQVAMVAPEEATRTTARAAAERLLRDVVAASSVVTIPVEHGTIRAGGKLAP
jgi:ATP-dependent RNA helicase HelY